MTILDSSLYSRELTTEAVVRSFIIGSTLSAMDDSSDAFAEFHKKDTSCVACNAVITSYSETAILPCFHTLCRDCALAEEDGEANKCPAVITSDVETALGLSCGNPFTRSQIFIPPPGPTAPTGEEGRSGQQPPVTFNCGLCRTSFPLEQAVQHAACMIATKGITPVDFELPCEPKCPFAGEVFCPWCLAFRCRQCMQRRCVHVAEQDWVTISSGFGMIERNYRSADELCKRILREQSHLLASLSATLLERRARFLDTLKDSPEVATALSKGIDANIKQVEHAYDLLVVKRDLLLAAEKLFLDTSNPIRLRVAALARHELIGSRIRRTAKPPFETTPGLDAGRNMIYDRVYSSNVVLGAGSMKAGVYHIGRDFYSVKAPRKSIPWSTLQFCFNSDGHLVMLQAGPGPSSLTVLVLDSDANDIPDAGFVVPFPEDDMSRIKGLHTGAEGAVLVHLHDRLIRISVPLRRIDLTIDFTAALSLASTEYVSSVAPSPKGCIFVTIVSSAAGQFRRYPLVKLSADGELCRDADWCDEQVLPNGDHPLVPFFWRTEDRKDFAVVTDDYVVVAFNVNGDPPRQMLKFSINDGRVMGRPFITPSQRKLYDRPSGLMIGIAGTMLDIMMWDAGDVSVSTAHSTHRLEGNFVELAVSPVDGTIVTAVSDHDGSKNLLVF